jgi:hypothetical protein
MTDINSLWNSEREHEWHSALANYWSYVKPTHLAVEKEFHTLDSDGINEMNSMEWYKFLLQKYFFWKYTAPNRYATTTAQLKKYANTPDGLDDLFLIKRKLFSFNKDDIVSGLRIAGSIHGLGTAGASGLLAVLFPRHFATVDQFAVKALVGIEGLPERMSILSMKPTQLTIRNAVVLVKIMKDKAEELDTKFATSFWTPRRIDMILWSAHRSC